MFDPYKNLPFQKAFTCFETSKLDQYSKLIGEFSKIKLLIAGLSANANS